VVGLGLVLLVAAVANNLVAKKWQHLIGTHALFVSTIHPFVLTPGFFLGYWYRLHGTQWSTEDGGEAHASTLSFAKRSFFMMAIFDTVMVVLQTVASPQVTGMTLGLLGQASIPLSMATAWLYLGERFGSGQLLGAAMIVAGAVVQTMAKDSSSPALQQDSLPHVGLFLASLVPSCFGRIYQEEALGNANVEPFYLQGWVALFQTALTIVLLPFFAFWEGHDASPRGILALMQGGVTCLQGTNVHPGDVCTGGDAAFWLGAFLLVNFVFNVVAMEVVKAAGANIFFLLMAVRLPVQTLCFSLYVVMGEHAEPLNASGLSALGLTLAGLAVYRLANYALLAAAKKAE